MPGPNDVSTVPAGGGNVDTSQEVEASKAFTDLFGPNSKPEISKKQQRPQTLSKVLCNHPDILYLCYCAVS